jgi:ATP/maltotriose-dependent transcriptional regulator MalT
VITVLSVTEGPAAFHLGTLSALLGRDDDANAHFSQALELSRKLNSPYLIARTEIEWARLLLARGTEDRARADAMLEGALGAARRHGFGALIESAAPLVES